MSRSRRKAPIIGITSAESDKPFKVSKHRAERRTYRARLIATLDQDDQRLHATDYGNPNLSDKDGKQYCPGNAREMRK